MPIMRTAAAVAASDDENTRQPTDSYDTLDGKPRQEKNVAAVRRTPTDNYIALRDAMPTTQRAEYVKSPSFIRYTTEARSIIVQY